MLRAKANIRRSDCQKKNLWSALWKYGARRKCPNLNCAIPGMAIRSIYGPPAMMTSPQRWRAAITSTPPRNRKDALFVAQRKTSYEFWLEEEGLPVVGGYGVTDVRALPLKPWKRTGGRGAYIDLKGMEGFTGMYVGEIEPGAALHPEHHLYEELIYIIQGIGATELWSAGDEGKKMHFEWQPGSLFAIPLNSRHRMINGSKEPVFFLAV